MIENYSNIPESTLDLGNGYIRVYTSVKEVVDNEGNTSFQCQYIDIKGDNKIQCVRDYVISEIESYYNSDDINLISIKGIDIYLNPDTRYKLKERLDAAKAEGIKYVNITLNGNTFNLSVVEADVMLNKIVLQYAAAYDVKELKKKDVYNIDNISYMLDYNVMSNYPKKLEL